MHVYQKFWEIWPVREPKARILNEQPFEVKIKPIIVIFRFVRDSLENPASAIPTVPLQSLRHAIHGITISEFKTFAKCWAEASAKVLGSRV